MYYISKKSTNRIMDKDRHVVKLMRFIVQFYLLYICNMKKNNSSFIL